MLESLPAVTYENSAHVPSHEDLFKDPNWLTAGRANICLLFAASRRSALDLRISVFHCHVCIREFSHTTMTSCARVARGMPFGGKTRLRRAFSPVLQLQSSL